MLLNKADKTQVWSMENMGQDVKTAMTGGSVAVVGKNAVLSENIVDGQVLPTKTSFLEMGKNIFDGNYLSNVAITTDSGVLSTMKVASSSNAIAAIIPIITNQTYTIKAYDTFNRFRVGIMNSLPNITATPLAVDTPLYDSTSSGIPTSFTFTNTVSGKYLLVYVSNQNEKPRLQVELGNNPTEYEPFSYKLKSQSPKSVSETLLDDALLVKVNNGNSIKDLLQNINQFNGIYESGAIATYAGQTTCDFVTATSGKVAILKVSKNTTYSIKVIGAANRFKIAATKSTTKPVAPLTGIDVVMYNDTLVDKKYTFNSGVYEWIIIYVSNQNETPNLNVTIGDVVDTFIPYTQKKLVIGKDNLSPDVLTGQQQTTQTNKYYFLDEISGIYEKPSNIQSVASGQALNLVASPYTTVIAIYDDLVSTRYPSYVTKNPD
jgi:hypothetical protein